MAEPMPFDSAEDIRAIIADLLRPYAEHPDLDLELARPETPLRRLRIVRDILVVVTVDVEDSFSITIEDDAMRLWKTVGCIFDCVMARLTEQGRAPAV